MHRLLKAALLSSLSLAHAEVASADQFVAGLGLLYLQKADKDVFKDSSSDASAATRTDLDLLIGYKMTGGLTFGLRYLNGGVAGSSTTTVDVTSTTSTSKNTTTGYGPAVGWLQDHGGFGVTAAYLLGPASESVVTAAGSEAVKSVMSKGSGLALNLGYHFMFGSVGFGPELSYTTLTFKAAKVNGEDDPTFSSATETAMTPLFNVMIEI